LERDDLTFDIHHEGLREFTRQVQRMVNRMALTMLLSAMIIALGLLMIVYHPPGWDRFGVGCFDWPFCVPSVSAPGWCGPSGAPGAISRYHRRYCFWFSHSGCWSGLRSGTLGLTSEQVNTELSSDKTQV
jgi:hypothetical protein